MKRSFRDSNAVFEDHCKVAQILWLQIYFWNKTGKETLQL